MNGLTPVDALLEDCHQKVNIQYIVSFSRKNDFVQLYRIGPKYSLQILK